MGCRLQLKWMTLDDLER